MAKKRAAKASGAGTAGMMTLKIVSVALLVLALIGLALYMINQQSARQRGLVQSQAVAQGVASRLADVMRLYSGVLTRYVRNPQLGRELAAEDQAALRKRASALRQLLPEASAVRFLPIEWDRTNQKANPPISFATLEMLRAVEHSGKPSVAEVHQLGQGQPHVALAAPVVNPDSGETAGVAQLVLPMRLLSQALDIGNQLSGAVILQQVVGDGKAMLAESSPGSEAGRVDGEVAVAGTLWRVAYRGGTQGAGDQLMVWSVLGAALLLLAVMVFVLLKGLGKGLVNDRETMLALLKALLAGGGDRPPPRASVAELQPVMDLLARPKAGMEAVPASDGKRAQEMAAVASAVEKSRQDDVEPASEAVRVSTLAEEIFRAYDIRGVVGESLSDDSAYQIGRAVGTLAGEQGERTIIIGRDGRNSSETLSAALARGLNDSGRDVVDIGLVPTPVLYFATHFLGSNSGVMVTGSHNAPQYNGMKVVLGGEALSAGQIREIYRRIVNNDLASGEGALMRQDLVPDYIARITEDVQLLSTVKLVIDCGNGAASVIAPSLFRALGCEVIDLYCNVDGNFPNHHPNPGDPANMQALIRQVHEQGADLGVAFDGDGDRLGVVDSQGRIIWPDRLLMLLARDVLLRHPGTDVIYDVKSSRHLASEILTYGGRPIMWKSGHSLVKAKMRETGALLAAEMSGHVYFKDRWYGFDDALYSCARLLEVMTGEGMESADLFDQFPESVATPEYYANTDEGESFALIEKLAGEAEFPGAKLVTIDGIRAEFEDGWGLARPSNTSPAVVFRFEADGESALARIQGLFREQFAKIAPTLRMPF